MTATIRPIAPALDAAARRKRARRFWGAMGATMRFEDRRPAPADICTRNSNETLAFRDLPRRAA